MARAGKRVCIVKDDLPGQRKSKMSIKNCFWKIREKINHNIILFQIYQRVLDSRINDIMVIIHNTFEFTHIYFDTRVNWLRIQLKSTHRRRADDDEHLWGRMRRHVQVRSCSAFTRQLHLTHDIWVIILYLYCPTVR